jgi:peroxiredoxin (alkyl hydroperoxide reductase subunit C)
MSEAKESTQPNVRIGDVAPNFLARSTRGPFELSAHRGKWVLLFSHPADFTPVCTSEFIAFAKAQADFAELGVDLVGFSVDTLFAHFAWLRLIRDEFGVEVKFPVVEDPTMVIARAYGMVGPEAVDAASVRSTYIIDPDGIVQAVSTYPMNVGRSISEILRLVTALQATWKSSQLAPADWDKGAPLLRAPSSDFGDVMQDGTPAGWFYKEAR